MAAWDELRTGPGSIAPGLELNQTLDPVDLNVTLDEPTTGPGSTAPTPEPLDIIPEPIEIVPPTTEPLGVVTTPPTPIPEIKEEVAPEPTPILPTPAPVIDKVESAEDIKSKQLDIKAKEDAQITGQQEKTLASFDAAIKSWNLEAARNLSIENPDLRNVFNSQVKAFLWDKSNIDFFKKFSWMSNDRMLTQVDSWKLVIGSDQYKLLPPEQRASFEAFKTQKDAISVRKDFDSTPGDKVESLEELVTQMKDLFDTNLKTKYNELLNSDEIKSSWLELNSLKTQIKKEDRAINKIADDVRKEFPSLEASKQQSIINDRKSNAIDVKNSLIDQYNSELGTYQTLKDNAKTELDFFKFEDAQNKQIYQTALGLYESRRSEMRDDEKLAFQEKSKKLASDRSFQNQKDMIEFKNDLDSKNISGKWQALQDGLYFLKDDGTAQKVLGWDKVNETKKDNIKISEWKNDDGTITVSMTNEDTQENSIFTKDVFGNVTYPNGVALNWTDLRSLQNKYPWQAWAKNNNSAWLTFQSSSPQLQWEWAEAWVSFSKWTKRPKDEGNNYVQFPTIQDGLAAHAITLGRKRSSIQNWLAQWVWTPNRATNLAYAQDLYDESGITKPISTPLNKLTDWELYGLMKAQIKRESPWLYSEMRQKGWLGQGKFNIPVTVEETATHTSNINNLLNVILPPKANEITKKSLTFGSRMADSVSNILELEKKFNERDALGQRLQTWAPNFLKDEDQQLFETFKENFITASLRLESGAAIGVDEFEREERKFFPAPWDTQATIQAKQEQREISIQLMLNAAGRDEGWTLVRDYYTPNDIEQVWANKWWNPSESAVDDYLKSIGVNTIVSDPVLQGIFAEWLSINQTGTWAWSLNQWPPRG